MTKVIKLKLAIPKLAMPKLTMPLQNSVFDF